MGDDLKERWAGNEKKLKELIAIIKADPDWYKSEPYKVLMDSLGPLPKEIREVERDLRGANLSGANLAGANLSGANLSKADLAHANLSGANLVGANLSGIRTHLHYANLSGANLVGANLSEAVLEMANLSGARADYANLSRSILYTANLSETVLYETNLSGANLAGANLSGAFLQGALYTTDEVFNQLMTWWTPQILRRIPFVKHSKEWKPMGITDFGAVDTSKINGSTNPVLKRHIEDFQFILGFKEKSWLHRRLFYPLWKITSDCGRSLLLWLIWSVVIAGFFSVVYANNLDWFKNAVDWFNAIYFSVVTFTTLGLGDVTPNLTNRVAQTVVMAEVIIGYVMLGGLISILANKLARRA